MTGASAIATVLIVPGLRDAVPGHWQTLLHAKLESTGRPVRTVLPMGRDNIDLKARIDALEQEAQAIDGPLVIVAHSAGCITVAHWARTTRRQVLGALLATPPDLDRPMPDGYPSFHAMRAEGWSPMPGERLPFPSILAASTTDPLASCPRLIAMAACWGCRLIDLGDVGHLNPASGHGPWPRAEALIAELARAHA
jgi:predicted alpha/beta hydrolase family esterase